VQDFFRIVAETQDMVSFTPQEFYASADHVFVLGHYAWKMRKTGKEADADWVHIFTIKNGQVTSSREFSDTAQFAEALRG
jgi:uncharacterized protein